MKKILSFILSLAMVPAMCVCMNITAFAQISGTGTGTKADPYVVSTMDDFAKLINNSPTGNMNGTPTYICIGGDITYTEYTFSIGNLRDYEIGKNIDLDLNGHTLLFSGFYLESSKLSIHNGTVKSDDEYTGNYASPALQLIEGSVLNADSLTFQGGNGMASGILGGYGLLIDSSAFFIKNCTVISGNSFSDEEYITALNVCSSTGTISNTKLIRGSGMVSDYYKTLKIDNDSVVTDADGNRLYSSDLSLNEIYIPKAYAETPITAVGGSKTFSAKGTYQSGAQSDTVYRVDIAWGSMEFTYSDGNDGTWNPLTHEYTNAVSAGWSCGMDENKITVTNRSNVAIDAGLTYVNEDGFNLAAKFTDSERTAITRLSLPTAEAYGKTESGPRSSDAYMNITNGAISSGTAAKTTLGTITVTISNAE